MLSHDAVAVADGAEAIEQLVAEKSRFDLILLDDAMPGMSGRETFVQLMALGISVPVVICSGRNVIPEEFATSAADRPIAVLAKPFTMRSLQSVLAQASPQ